MCFLLTFLSVWLGTYISCFLPKKVLSYCPSLFDLMAQTGIKVIFGSRAFTEYQYLVNPSRSI